jgi:hypothetical protein
MAINMGLDKLGYNSSVFKRKFRWTMEFQNVCYAGITIPPSYVKSGNRPSITIAEQEINYLNGKMYIPGKADLEAAEFVYYDVASADAAQAIAPLFVWLSTVYDITNAKQLRQSSRMGGAAGSYSAQRGVLVMYDGCGAPIDSFTYLDPWPTNINFGDLDYSNNEECTITLSIRYRNFEYQTLGKCAPDFEPLCGGCYN